MWKIVLLSILVGIALARGTPHFLRVQPDMGYHALVRENSRQVRIMPEIRVGDGPVCSFRVSWGSHRHPGGAGSENAGGGPPFEVRLIDGNTGAAQLIPTHELNCEHRHQYKFDIQAVGCNQQVSKNVTVHLTVEDVNEFAPEFAQETYQASAREGKLYQRSPILQVRATDGDCTPKNSDICRYELLDEDQPFSIDSEGNIRNKEPLLYDRSHNYIFQVVAYDCSMKASRPVTVTITVLKQCHAGWKNVPERIEYGASGGRRTLFPEATLETCDDDDDDDTTTTNNNDADNNDDDDDDDDDDDNAAGSDGGAAASCDADKFSARVQLTTDHIGKGCDRDTYSPNSQRKACGATLDSVELLPSARRTEHRDASATTHSGSTPAEDEGRDNSDVYHFDGRSNALVISSETLDHRMPHTFALNFWMKHEARHNDKHAKEHIVCTSDDHMMSRHHFSLFIHNCRLVMLMRIEPDDSLVDHSAKAKKTKQYLPAEWRWKVGEVCDNHWHHYTLNIQFPRVELFIDGKLTTVEPDIVDDYPLHRSNVIHNTTMVVGACWQGKSRSMQMHFGGYLSDFTVLRNATEKPSVLACLYQCKETLEPPPALGDGAQVSLNSLGNELWLQSDDQDTLEEMLNHVTYRNARDYPTAGKRMLHIATAIKCANGQTRNLPVAETFLTILPSPGPTITIEGTPNLAREYEPFKQGVDLFASVKLNVGPAHESEGDADGNSRTLDSCSIQVYPPLNPDHESLNVPSYMLNGIKMSPTKNDGGAGIVLEGPQKASLYERILHQVTYTNTKPAYYLNRAFRLVCSQMNGRFLSNEYLQTLTVIHPHPNTMPPKGSATPAASEPTQQTHAMPARPEALVQHPSDAAHHLQAPGHDGPNSRFSDSLANASASHTVTVIVVVCVVFLVFLIVLGVVRIRAAQSRLDRVKTHHLRANGKHHDAMDELQWDDSALTITVNPMEQFSAQEADVMIVDPNNTNNNATTQQQQLKQQSASGVATSATCAVNPHADAVGGATGQGTTTTTTGATTKKIPARRLITAPAALLHPPPSPPNANAANSTLREEDEDVSSSSDDDEDSEMMDEEESCLYRYREEDDDSDEDEEDDDDDEEMMEEKAAEGRLLGGGNKRQASRASAGGNNKSVGGAGNRTTKGSHEAAAKGAIGGGRAATAALKGEGLEWDDQAVNY